MVGSAVEGTPVTVSLYIHSVAPSMCLPLLDEKCLIAPVVAAKTTRMINPATLKKFIDSNPDVQVIHSVSRPLICINIDK